MRFFHQLLGTGMPESSGVLRCLEPAAPPLQHQAHPAADTALRSCRPPATAWPVLYGGVRFAEDAIDTAQHLSAIGFHEVVNDVVKLGPHFHDRVAVVRIGAATRHCLLFVDRRATPDDLVAVVELLGRHGLELPPEGPQAHWTPSALVMGLSQGHLDGQGQAVARRGGPDADRGALFNAFVDVVTWGHVHQADDIDFAVDQQSPISQVAFKIAGRYLRPQRFALPTDFIVQMLGIAWQRSGGGASAAFDLRIEQQARIDLDLPKSDRLPQGARLRLRWSGMANDRGTVVTLRLQRLGEGARIRSLESAGYPASQLDTLRRVVRSEGGMVVLSGVVGSGKSTTLAQLMALLPPDIKMVSVEDPVELEIARMYQKTLARDLESTGPEAAFAAATRALYRSALDVLLLGEVRDRETGLLARQVVEAGHSVYTTTHARSALGVIDRFVSPCIGLPREVLASPGILKLLVYQALLPINCPHCCRSPAEHAQALGLEGRALEQHLRWFHTLHSLYDIDPGRFRLRNPEGCPHCRRPELPELDGFAGRTVASEMIEPDEALLALVLAGNSLAAHRHWRAQASASIDDEDLRGKTAMDCAVHKALGGLIDPREIEPRFMAFETLLQRRAGAAS
jgi:general secretion pathway protein E